MATPLALVWELIAVDSASEVFKKVGAEAGLVSKETSKIGPAFAKLGGILALAGAAMTVVAVKMAVDMQESTAKIAGNAQISTTVATRIGDSFLATAGKSTFSGKAMSDAFGPVAGVIQTLSGHTLNAGAAMKVMNAATMLAEATGKPLAATTADLAAVMQNYKIGLSGAAEASNTLFNASRLTNVDLDTLTSMVDKLHGKLGIASPSLADTSALMVDLANHGISGSKGLMVVNSGLTTLLGGSKTTNAELKTLGVRVFDASGKFVGMKSVLEQLTPKLKDMTEQQRLAAEKALFGSGAAKALNSTIMAGADGLGKATSAVTKHGAAEYAAKTASETLGGQMKTLKAAFADIVTTLGEKLIPVITDVVTWFGKHKTVTEVLAVSLGTLAAAAVVAKVASLASAAATGVASAAQAVWSAVVGTSIGETLALKAMYLGSAIASGVMTAAQWLLNAALTANPIGIVVVAIGALVAGIIWVATKTTWFQTIWEYTWGAVKVVIGNVVSVVIELFRRMLGAWTTVVGGLLSAAATIAEKLHLPFAASMRKASDAFNTMAKAADQKLKDVATSASKWGDQTGKNYAAGLGGAAYSVKAAAANLGLMVAQGFASGIRGGTVLAELAATSMAAKAQSAMAANLRSHSPSKATEEIGRFFGEGFVNGIVGTQSQVASAVDRLVKLALNTHNKGVIALVVDARTHLERLAGAWEAMTTRVQAAVANLAQLKSNSAQLVASVTSQVVGTGDFTGGSDKSFTGIVTSLTSAKDAAGNFASVMAKLKTAGLDKTTISQLIAAGPASLEAAQSLLESGKSGIRQINALQAGIAKSAASLGKTAAANLYATGIAVASGLVKGLQSQEAALEAQMKRIATIMAETVKAKLKIHSPSQVFHDMGLNVGAGLVGGVDASRAGVAASMNRLVALPTAGSLDFASSSVRSNAISGASRGATSADIAELGAIIRALPKTYQMGMRQGAR